MNQNHLNYKETTNLGSYYTPKKYVEKCYQFLINKINNINDFYIVDTSCGYGNFFNVDNIINTKNCVGIDIDKKAIDIAKSNNPQIKYFNFNSLSSINRKNYQFKNNDKIIIIGNPPYNDTTSIIKQNIKNNKIEIDSDIKTRDLGLSFLLSYQKLNADYICVLHPLSYLIKESNFKLLKKFTSHYRLINSLIFNSQEFNDNSKTTGFPIVIAFYQKDYRGMNYDFIKNYSFKTAENNFFKLNSYDTIDNYITKYPNKKHISKDETICYFWTMRDINALKRSRTFVEQESYNTIRIVKEKMHYYCYVDVFKKFISNVPYYFGNSNVMLDYSKYQNIKSDITKYSINTNSILKQKFKIKNFNLSYTKNKIRNYFKELLKEHYVH